MKTFPVLSAITVLLGGITPAEIQPATGFFPFPKGRYWLYDGSVKFTQGVEVKEKKSPGGSPKWSTRWKARTSRPPC